MPRSCGAACAAPHRGFPVGFDRLSDWRSWRVRRRGRAPWSGPDAHKAAAGLVHGGVFASIAEALPWPPPRRARGGQDRPGLSNQTSFLRPIIDGTIHATARRRHRGRTTWVWEVDITDDAGRLCALVRMTIAVRRLRPGRRGR